MMDGGFQTTFLVKLPVLSDSNAICRCSPPPHTLRRPTYVVPHSSHA
ncbi:hypothetical protein RISK_004636 [Rhodopirellula islandica]|uniref:Uncharacterized protein n=1 Tax=Rhodopirellula islandica TaxID=595434 RepID=A0A0J1ECQ1_RHOIS|nr:hypothetical protein RISK_004636 [Rhodopirellula islandica]